MRLPGRSGLLLRSLQVRGGNPAVATGLGVERDALFLDEVGHARRLDRRDMDEDVFGSVFGFDESEPFCGVEKLHDADRHRTSP